MTVPRRLAFFIKTVPSSLKYLATYNLKTVKHVASVQELATDYILVL